MATNSIPKSDVAYMESPASWNTRYVTPEGFTCQITIRGENGKDLLDKAGVALSYLLEHGFHIGVSLDGNRQSHDLYRRYASGRSSHVSRTPIASGSPFQRKSK